MNAVADASLRPRFERLDERWQEQAICRTEYGPAFDREPLMEQKAACARCRVKAECLDFALRTEPAITDQSKSPIYAGTGPRDRSELRAEIRGATEYLDGLQLGDRVRALDAIVGYLVLASPVGSLTSACQLAQEVVG